MNPAKKRFKLILPALCLCLAGVAALLFFLFFHDSGKGWTVMVYMVGTDLESQNGLASKDLQEMAQSVRRDTTLLVMAGGSRQWSNGFQQESCGLYRVEKNKTTLLSPCQGGMGQAETLEALLRAGLSQAHGPTALILWDHGYGAMEGVGNDEIAADPRLTLAELRQALENTGARENRLTVIGFDACLMAGCETALMVSPYADYLVASQETEPPEGWDYGFLSALEPDADGETVGRRVVSSFCAFYQQHYQAFPSLEQPYTLSLIHLRKTDALAAAMDEMLKTARLDAWDADFSATSRVCADAWGFGRAASSTEYDLIDLNAFLSGLEKEGLDARPALDAFQDCLLLTGGSVSEARGLSLYLPLRAEAYHRARWRDAMGTFPLGENWLSFMNDYESALSAHAVENGLAPSEGGYAVQLTDEQLESFHRAKYFVLEETAGLGMRLVYAGNDYTLEGRTLTVPYQGQCLMLRTPKEDCPMVAFYIQSDGGAAYYQTFVGLEKPAASQDEATAAIPARIRLQKDLETGTYRVLSAFDTSADMVTGRQEIPVTNEDTLVIASFLYEPVLDGDLQPLSYNQWKDTRLPYVGVLSLKDGFSFEEAPLPREEGRRYWLQIVAVDSFQGESASPLIPLFPGDSL